MVLGNGLLANAFSAFKDDKDVFVFASGVSNSKENNPLEFEKEFQLLKDKIRENTGVKLIYFSTCSIFNHNSPLVWSDRYWMVYVRSIVC